MVSAAINLPLRGFQFVWTLLIMALTGNVIHEAISGNPSVINYTMFTAVFSMITLPYLGFVAIKGELGHAVIPIALDVLNALFFFCGGVALAAGLDVHSCNNNAYTLANGLTNGSRNRNKRCTELQAVTAFMWFNFALYVATSIFSAFASGGSGRLNMRPGGIRKGGPVMSQV